MAPKPTFISQEVKEKKWCHAEAECHGCGVKQGAVREHRLNKWKKPTNELTPPWLLRKRMRGYDSQWHLCQLEIITLPNISWEPIEVARSTWPFIVTCPYGDTRYFRLWQSFLVACLQIFLSLCAFLHNKPTTCYDCKLPGILVPSWHVNGTASTMSKGPQANTYCLCLALITLSDTICYF